MLSQPRRCAWDWCDPANGLAGLLWFQTYCMSVRRRVCTSSSYRVDTTRIRLEQACFAHFAYAPLELERVETEAVATCHFGSVARVPATKKISRCVVPVPVALSLHR